MYTKHQDIVDQYPDKTPKEILYELFDNPMYPWMKDKAFVGVVHKKPYPELDTIGFRYLTREKFESEPNRVRITDTFPRSIIVEFE